MNIDKQEDMYAKGSPKCFIIVTHIWRIFLFTSEMEPCQG